MKKKLAILTVLAMVAALISLGGGLAVAGPPPSGDRYVDDDGLCRGNTPAILRLTPP